MSEIVKCETLVTVMLTLTLTKEQATYLKELVQNPAYDNESADVSKLREHLFNSLKNLGA